jgi:hypothetical protein
MLIHCSNNRILICKAKSGKAWFSWNICSLDPSSKVPPLGVQSPCYEKPKPRVGAPVSCSMGAQALSQPSPGVRSEVKKSL